VTARHTGLVANTSDSLSTWSMTALAREADFCVRCGDTRP
jgi:hypothetical protein